MPMQAAEAAESARTQADTSARLRVAEADAAQVCFGQNIVLLCSRYFKNCLKIGLVLIVVPNREGGRAERQVIAQECHDVRLCGRFP